MSTVNDKTKYYSSIYKILAPDQASLSLTRDIWIDWEKKGNVPPDIDELGKNYSRFENGFFYDIVSMAEKREEKKLNIHYCAFCLDEYNFYAFSAEDGFIVLVDDYFLQFLFILCLVLVFDAEGLIEEHERNDVKDIMIKVIKNNYFRRRRFDFEREKIVQTLLKRDIETAEIANYFFNSLKLFIFSHEIGHHVLGHTKGKINKTFGMFGSSKTIEVDLRNIEDEFEADKYGYALFREVSNTVDKEIYYAFFKYKFEYAPLFLFELFEKLDKISATVFDKVISYTTHPNPTERYNALLAAYDIDVNYPWYLQLKRSLNDLI